jgi:HSP20 family molecular chaperone IbpA
MQEQNVARNQITELPIVIKTMGLSPEAKEMVDAIARRAYEIFESKGKVTGRELENWLQAEAELFESAPLNVGQSQDGVTVLADVRDFTPKELEIDLEPMRVTIIGKSHSLAAREAGARSAAQRHKIRMLRSVQLPVEIDASRTTARLKDGVLELKLRKATAPNHGSS